MEVFVKLHKILKFAIYNTVFFTSDGGVDEVLVRLSKIEQIIKDAI